MHKINIFLDSVEGEDNRAALLAFYLCLMRSGENVQLIEVADYLPCDIAVVFGAPKPGAGVRETRRKIYAAHKGPFIVLDSAVMGRSVYLQRPSWWRVRQRLRKNNRTLVNATTHFRIGLNGAFHNTADFCNHGSPPDRWQELSRAANLPLLPYRETGRHILLVGQIPSDASLQGADIIGWMEETIHALRQRTKRRIVVRPHPGTQRRDLKRIKARILGRSGVKLDMPPSGTIRDALSGCFLCVTYSSSAAIDALLMGVPAVAMSPASLAWPVTDHDLERLEDPTLYPREQWLHDLAYAQWTEAEIGSGLAWARLKEKAQWYLSQMRETPSHIDDRPTGTDG